MGLEAQSVAPAVSPPTSAADSATAGQAASAPAFEQILQELEALVTQLESGDLPLDEALRTFERGVRLTRECQAVLTTAQQKVQLLLQRGESVVLEEFDRGAVESAAAAATGSESALEP
jgi:exodeoxyribonuclease VII small subunit